MLQLTGVKYRYSVVDVFGIRIPKARRHYRHVRGFVREVHVERYVTGDTKCPATVLVGDLINVPPTYRSVAFLESYEFCTPL